VEAVSHWIFGARQRSADGIASQWMTKGVRTPGVGELGFLRDFFPFELGGLDDM
jgi:hypothetical protein